MTAVRFQKPEVVFISAVDWDISSKFGVQLDFHLLKQKLQLISDSMAAILKNRYDVITLPPILWLQRQLASRCKMTCW